MALPSKSYDKLKGVHSDLVKIIVRAAESSEDVSDFVVTEGIRSYTRQRELFLAGKSQTMHSRHLTGHAVDLAVWEDRDQDKVVDADELSWKFPAYKALADHIKAIAKELDIQIVWGGDWVTLKDGPHFELDRRYYP